MTYAPAVLAEGLTKRFRTRTGSVTAVDGLDLRIEAGTVFGLIGPNASGKSTTMRLLLDLIRPTGGTMRVLGQEPGRGGAALRRRIGYLPGELVLDGGLSVRATLRYFADLSGGADPERTGRLCERLGLDPAQRVGTLSKGNKQKVGLVQAFQHAPDLLVLDEPTSGLDPLVQQQFRDMVRESAGAGATVFLSSHDLSEVEHVADSAAVLRRGRLLRVDTIDRLRRDAARSVRAHLHARVEDVRAALASRPALASLSADPVTGPSPSATAAATAGATGTTEDVVLVTGTLEGHADALVDLLSGFEVTDLTVQPYDLEESVLNLYGSADPAIDHTHGRRAGMKEHHGHSTDR